MANPPNARLCAALGYAFHRPEGLEEALTHRSASAHNNERLEFLGDALLNLIVAEYLFQHYPKASEGELSRLRASLVKGETLADLARELKLGDWLRMGPGELKSGGYRRESILSDTLEAIIGAVYLDGGFGACRDLVLHLYQNWLARLSSASELKDPKTRLQDICRPASVPCPSITCWKFVANRMRKALRWNASSWSYAPSPSATAAARLNRKPPASCWNKFSNGSPPS